MTKRPSLALITTFGLGYRRPFSGTWGSLPPVLLAGALFLAGIRPDTHPILYNAILLAVLLVFSGACIAQGDAAESRFGEKDPTNVVADETAGQCLPLLFLPHAAIQTPASTTFTLLLAFVAFRVLDIAKPFPARQLQRVPGGWGILLDDLFAGAYALVLLQLAAALTPLRLAGA